MRSKKANRWAEDDLHQLALTCLEVAFGERPTRAPWMDMKAKADEDLDDLRIRWCRHHAAELRQLEEAIPGLAFH